MDIFSIPRDKGSFSENSKSRVKYLSYDTTRLPSAKYIRMSFGLEVSQQCPNRRVQPVEKK